ncbi:hypothetical protein HYX02_00420 [Candidatus Woesearchaeota archaeon]|nr:hypothetical protein [Candidatus Woesearchaeota archaeon]
MRKINLIWILALFLIIPNTLAYINCTTSACPSGYTDNGVKCEGSTCVRNCTVEVCKQDWTQVASDTNVGFLDNSRVEDNDISSSYTPTNTGRCYNFTYDATHMADHEVSITVDPVSPDCDSEAIGGFWDDTQRSSPWFNGMNNYIGNVGDPEFDYLIKTMRAHTEADADSTYRSKIRVKEGVLCSPNTVACSGVGGSGICDTDCYNRATILNVHQGYYYDQGTPDSTLYTDSECGDNLGGANDYVNINRIGAVTPPSVKYIVYESTLINQSNDQSCDRTHEAPSVSNVSVLPEIPNAGQDLLCNYTYSDPENFTEQNSSYQWWKNSVNQNINSQTLAKNNLTPGDQWYCKVTPSDGLLFGTQVQSANTVTIRNATQNPILYVNNSQAWNNTGYFGNEENVLDFNQELNNALANCSEDSEGYCNVSLAFSSNNFGILNLSDFGVYYIQDNVSVVVSLKIESITEMYSNGTLKIFEFVILNNGSNTVTNVQWQFDTANNNVINSTINISSLAVNEKEFVYLAYNFSSGGTFNVKANATGISESTAVTASLTASVTVNTTSLPDINKFLIKNSSGSNIAWFGDAGNIVIKGVLEQSSNFQATDNFAFKIRNNLNDVLIIENNGSMYIDGTLQENQGTLTSGTNKNDFRIKDNSSNLVAFVNEGGYLFLKGSLK